MCTICILWRSLVLAQPVDDAAEGEPAAPFSEADGPPIERWADDVITAPAADPISGPPESLRYVMERVEVKGNTSTRTSVILDLVTLRKGDLLDVDDPAVQWLRWRLLGTGWFENVRLSLAKGSRRGAVVLVIEVDERNTFVVQRGTVGVSKVVRRTTAEPVLEPYVGLGLAETNLFGLGVGLGVNALVSTAQYGVAQYGMDVRYDDPKFRGTPFELRGRAFFNHAREFFGKENFPLVSIRCRVEPEMCPEDVLANTAVVRYDRAGVAVGTGRDLTRHLRYTLDWQGELVQVLDKPEAASSPRGSEVVPIDFRIRDGRSLLSTVQLGLIYDRRDDAVLPSRGQLIRFRAIAGTGLLGSDYTFSRVEAYIDHWSPLPWGHVVRLGAFAGSVFGTAPFFYHFYAADLSDLIPSRMLEINVDHRSPPNLLGTAIAEMRSEELAGRVDVEYVLPLKRGSGAVKGVYAYGGMGLYALASRQDLRVAIPGYRGLARIPVDLTFDLGIRADTSYGVFQFGFSNMIGFLPLFESRAP